MAISQFSYKIEFISGVDNGIMHFGGADRAIRECGRESEDLV